MPNRSSVSSLRQVAARALGLMGLEEDLAIPGDRRLERFSEAAAAPILAGAALRELDARLLRQSTQRLLEVEAVAPHDEGEDVSVLAAAEAMPRLAFRRDGEGRRLLRVEGAEALQQGAGTLELDRLPDHLRNGKLRLDVGDDAGRGADADALAHA
jgi:hypothetical protein